MQNKSQIKCSIVHAHTFFILLKAIFNKSIFFVHCIQLFLSVDPYRFTRFDKANTYRKGIQYIVLAFPCLPFASKCLRIFPVKNTPFIAK